MDDWRAKLAAGDANAAWDSFIARYRRLIFAVIRRTIADEDDASDVFAEVCADLSRDNLERLVRHVESGKARFSTWLVTVVHNRTIDWIRHRDGRRRVTVPAGLSPMQRQIFQKVVVERRSHVEAYEVIRQQGGSTISFGSFMNDVAATFRQLQAMDGQMVAHYFPGPPTALPQPDLGSDYALLRRESAEGLSAALDVLEPDERLAIQLFIVEELSAANVAKAIGWPNAKAVYNRVYRALGLLRSEMERQRHTQPPTKSSK